MVTIKKCEDSNIVQYISVNVVNAAKYTGEFNEYDDDEAFISIGYYEEGSNIYTKEAPHIDIDIYILMALLVYTIIEHLLHILETILVNCMNYIIL